MDARGLSPTARVLDMRPEPIGISVAFSAAAGLLVILGGGALLAAELVWNGTPYTGALYVAGYSLLPIGLLLAVFAGSLLLMRVRFVVSQTHLTIEWRRLGRLVRREHVALADVVDVGLDETPSSGSSVFGLVVGTRHGDISLSAGRSSYSDEYPRLRARLAAFIGVPERPGA